jgi:hypothetical protein
MTADLKAVLIGYFPKQIVPCPEFASARGVEEIGSVSTHISKGPANWITFWRHNDLWLFSSPDLAWSVVPQAERSAFRLFAYKLFPMRIVEAVQTEFSIPDLAVTPLDDSFLSVGYDVVCRTSETEFGCSPLSCNLLAEKIPVNRDCLLADASAAFELALKMETLPSEPGPYFVMEVFRQASVRA